MYSSVTYSKATNYRYILLFDIIENLETLNKVQKKKLIYKLFSLLPIFKIFQLNKVLKLNLHNKKFKLKEMNQKSLEKGDRDGDKKVNKDAKP